MKGFELKNWLTENREIVEKEFSELTEEKFYNGITKIQFFKKVFSGMQKNNPRSPKKAMSILPHLISSISFNNSCVTGGDFVTEKLTKKYEGTAYMAMV